MNKAETKTFCIPISNIEAKLQSFLIAVSLFALQNHARSCQWSEDVKLNTIIRLDSVKASIQKIKIYSPENKDNSNLNLNMCF